MFIQRKPFLKDIQRVRIPENRNLEEGLRLNRNERVDVWPADLLEKIFKDKPGYFLSTYPDSSTLYQKLGKHLGVDESKIMLTSGMDSGHQKSMGNHDGTRGSGWGGRTYLCHVLRLQPIVPDPVDGNSVQP